MEGGGESVCCDLILPPLTFLLSRCCLLQSDNGCVEEPTYRSRMVAHLPKLKILDGPRVTKRERKDAGHDVDDWDDDVDSDGEEDTQVENVVAGETVEIKSFGEISQVRQEDRNIGAGGGGGA
jgi:hypothetical protein